MPEFIPGLELSRIFYVEAVKSLLDAYFPALPHTACRIDSGSEVLGFDTPMSRDHDWGLRFQLFLSDTDYARCGLELERILCQHLPATVRGYPTNLDQVIEPDGSVTTIPAAQAGTAIKHRVHHGTLRSFFWDYLGWDMDSPLTAADWLTFPGQHLRTITQGAIYHDDLGMETLRHQFSFYPEDVWLYMMAAGWQRIGQEEHLMPRAGYVGDELGSAIIGSRLIRDVMRICFLIERQYAPYPKWLGTAFGKLQCAATLTPHLREGQFAQTWQVREAALSRAYQVVAEMHNALGLTERLPTTPSPFFTRPFQVIWGSRFAQSLVEKIHDPTLKGIAAKTLMGSVDQFVDSTDALHPSLRQGFKALYQVG